MKIDSDDFRVRHGAAIKLNKVKTRVKPFCDMKKKYQSMLAQHVSELSDLQHLHYASNRYALAVSQNQVLAAKIEEHRRTDLASECSFRFGVHVLCPKCDGATLQHVPTCAR